MLGVMLQRDTLLQPHLIPNPSHWGQCLRDIQTGLTGAGSGSAEQGDLARPQCSPVGFCCPRTLCFNDFIPVFGVGRKRWGLCKSFKHIPRKMTSCVTCTASPTSSPPFCLSPSTEPVLFSCDPQLLPIASIAMMALLGSAPTACTFVLLLKGW